MKIQMSLQEAEKESVLSPTGWVMTPLSKLVSPDGLFKDGDWVESKDQDPNGEVRLIQLADIGVSRFRDRSSRYLTKAKSKGSGLHP